MDEEVVGLCGRRGAFEDDEDDVQGGHGSAGRGGNEG